MDMPVCLHLMTHHTMWRLTSIVLQDWTCTFCLYLVFCRTLYTSLIGITLCGAVDTQGFAPFQTTA